MEKQKLKCPYCNSDAELTSSTKIYGKDYGYAWICKNFPKCDSYVGCHKGTKKSLGRLANKELRRWKNKAHIYFDRLWIYKIWKLNQEREGYHPLRKKSVRFSAYSWLAKELKIDINDCHIGMFDTDMCKKVVEICTPYFNKITRSNS